MGKFIDLTGQRFGRLTVVNRSETRNKRTYWNCVCDCGNTKVINSYKLLSGNTQSCRCLDTEMTIARTTKHGMSHSSPEYYIWKTMRQRCNNPNNGAYKEYGGRGVKVCKRWDKFESFYKDMGQRPSSKHQIERLDNDGDYEPSNCVWATQLAQANNKRNTLYITFRGVTKPISDWAREVGIQKTTIRARIFNYKWDVERALTKGVK